MKLLSPVDKSTKFCTRVPYEALNDISLGAPSENLAFSQNNKMAALLISLQLYCRRGYRTDITK